MVSPRFLWLCGARRHLAVPQLVTGWTCCRADRGFDVPCWCVDETWRVRRVARWHYASARRRSTLVMAYYVVRCCCCSLWRVHCIRPNRLEIHDRFLFRLAHGTGDVGFVHTQSKWFDRCRRADVFPRYHDSSLLCCHWNDL